MALQEFLALWMLHLQGLLHLKGLEFLTLWLLHP